MTQPDAKLLEDVVAEKVLAAWRTAAAALERAGVPYILIGGLAVGANGHPRATKDVDFLVGEGAFIQHGGGVVTMNPALPIQINGVAIDYLSPREGEGHLAAALVGPPGRVLDAPRLVYMKLRASRFQDKADIASLVKAGTDVDSCRTYLVAHAPELLALFDSIVTAAIAEE